MTDKELIEAPAGFLAQLRRIIGGMALPLPFDQVVHLNEGFKLCRVLPAPQDAAGNAQGEVQTSAAD